MAAELTVPTERAGNVKQRRNGQDAAGDRAGIDVGRRQNVTDALRGQGIHTPNRLSEVARAVVDAGDKMAVEVDEPGGTGLARQHLLGPLQSLGAVSGGAATGALTP